MPRQEILSPAQHTQLLMLPADTRQIADRYTFTQADLDLIAQCRGDQNCMGFAIQLCFLRYPGRAWTPEESIPVPISPFVPQFVLADIKLAAGERMNEACEAGSQNTHGLSAE